MVVIREDDSEEITDTYKTTRNGDEGVVIEADGGYFEYWFPYCDMSNKMYGPNDIVLDLTYMTIVEAPDGETSTYTGTDQITIPQHIVTKAKTISGYKVLE